MQCKFCGEATERVMDFGEVALAGAFIKASMFPKEEKYPLAIEFCPGCFSLQVSDPIDPEVLFSEYHYFSGQITAIREHFARYTDEIHRRFHVEQVFEIGCNDGTLLGMFADRGAKCIGVDPAKNVIESCKDERLTLVNEFFTMDTAEWIESIHGKQKLVLANNVFAHIPDIHGTTDALASILDIDGVLVVEVQHLGAMVEDLQYDWIYHEHLYYYSAISLRLHLERYGLEIFDVQKTSNHGGSIRYFIGHYGHHDVTDNVIDLITEEYTQGLSRVETFHRFAERAQGQRDALRTMIESIKKDGHSICGYGASGRANTILQWVGLDSRHISYIIDDAPAKVQLYTPGTHIRIVSADDVRATPTTYTLILAWPYADKILPKLKNTAIIPLPIIQIESMKEAA